MIYLDNAATTKVLPEVKQAVMSTIDIYGNPSSQHNLGKQASNILEKCRKEVLEYLGESRGDIVFTSSGSEANNLALQGWYFANRDKPCTIITTKIEHKSILKTCEFLETLGCEIWYVDIDNYGFVDINHLNMLCELCLFAGREFLVSIQGANSEIGTIQDIKTIAKIVYDNGGTFHSDMVQLFPEASPEFDVDMMSVSGHKFGCPKGIGFLYKSSKIDIEPLIHGGGQEFGLRAGTENLPYIAGISKAIDLLKTRMKEYNEQLKEKRDYLKFKLLEIKGSKINGSDIYRLCNNINISFKGIQSDALLAILDGNGICVSSGSACNSGDSEPSYVLKAIGVDKEYIDGTMRITIDNGISYTELDIVATEIADAVNALRMFN